MKTTFELWRIVLFFPDDTLRKPDDMGAVYLTRVEVTSPCVEASVLAMILRDADYIDTLGDYDGSEDAKFLEITKLQNGDWRIYTKDSGMLELRLLQ